MEYLAPENGFINQQKYRTEFSLNYVSVQKLKTNIDFD